MSEAEQSTGPDPTESFGDLEPDQPPLFDAQGRVRLSFSRIDTYRRCPLQFRYGYVDKLPSRPGPHLSFGTSIHRVLEWLYDRKLPDWPDADELVAALYDAWDSTGFRDVDRDEQLRFYRLGQQVLRAYHRRERDDFALPAGTEVWFELPVAPADGPADDPTAGGALIVGSIDRIDADADGGLHVVDYKTSRRVRDRQRVAGSLQLGIYALACEHLFGRLPETVCLDFVVPGTKVRVAVGDVDLDAPRRAALQAARGIRAEHFEPTPNNLCGWCDYRALCPAWEADGPAVLGPASEDLRRLRRSVRRDVRRLRHLEEGVERARGELRRRGLDPVGERPPGADSP